MGTDYIIIQQGDKEYPRCLLDLPRPPKRLYAKGNTELLTRPAVAIVGTRNCTRYGVTTTADLARTAAENGICVVSGLAEGIDAAAHKGAFPNTIAVLGNGPDLYYPAVNRGMQDQIAREGLLLTEYPPGFHGDKSTFPQRNRIVAALAKAVIVVEADIKSGTMITAGVARRIKREVFAVPGPINCCASRGANKLIADKRAKILCNAADMIRFLAGPAASVTSASGVSPAALQQVTFEQKAVLDILRAGTLHIDEILEKAGGNIQTLSTLLTNMEMAGLIEKLPGNMFAGI
jgi:DNA processing protein